MKSILAISGLGMADTRIAARFCHDLNDIIHETDRSIVSSSG